MAMFGWLGNRPINKGLESNRTNRKNHIIKPSLALVKLLKVLDRHPDLLSEVLALLFS